jgi:hypothetical protein
MNLKTKIAVVLLFICFDSFAQINDFKWKRKVNGVNDQWHSITLTKDVFEYLSPDFSDIRVYGITKNDTLESPYILKIYKEVAQKRTVDFKIINQTTASNGFYYTFLLDKEDAINHILLNFKIDNFDYSVNLEGSQNQTQWFSITKQYRVLSIKNKLSDYRFTQLSFPTVQYKYFRLFIPAKNNPGLLSANLSLTEVKKGESVNHQIKSFKIEQDKTNKQTFIHADLAWAVTISSIRIFAKSDFDFYRPLVIEYVTDSVKTEKGWVFNYSNLYDGNVNSIEKAEFKFESTLAKKIRIVIDNQDNQSLQIDSISVDGFLHKLLVRFDKPADYFLVYGNKNASKPQYDISQFEDKIPLTIRSVTLSEATPIVKNGDNKRLPLFLNKTWLWVILGLIILLMGWFTIKMMSKK